MGSQQFQREYISYLQDRNSDLLRKLNQMKENYEKKIFSNTFNNQNFNVEEIVSVCTALPKEIDEFFEKMTEAMNALQSLLIKKSEMVQLANKLTLTLKNNCTKSNSNFPNEDKRSGTVKVSPMIRGHVISTEPRICLNRVSNERPPMLELHELSPIVETSPFSDASLTRSNSRSDPMLTFDHVDDIIMNIENKGTPKIRLRPSVKTKQQMKKSISPLQVSNENKETTNAEENNAESDPLEGPSWLYNPLSTPKVQSPTLSNSFVNIRRRRQRFSDAFNKKIKPEQSAGNEQKSNGTLPVSIIETKEAEKSNDREVKLCVSSLPSAVRSSSTSSPEYIAGTPVKEGCRLISPNRILRKEPVVALVDCMLDVDLKETIEFKSDRSCIIKSRDVVKSEGSLGSNTSQEGRKRRRAAPTNLMEPKLST
ncbi:hypothetical protein RUM43_010076 [Polyplax serrata]|uniref:Uncharacterized protein n=1 Tax=Polyplax serrata TaxID=468196 RepID=A0AAN8S9X2_POLSC